MLTKKMRSGMIVKVGRVAVNVGWLADLSCTVTE